MREADEQAENARNGSTNKAAIVSISESQDLDETEQKAEDDSQD